MYDKLKNKQKEITLLQKILFILFDLFLLFLNPYQRICLLPLEREEGKVGEKEREKTSE